MSSLGHYPDNSWRFDAAVTDVFDDMLERSIPQHDVMRELITSLTLRFLPGNGTLVDLGCSRGESIARIIEHRPEATYLGVDASEPMVNAATQRFAQHPNVTITQEDLRVYTPPGNDVTLLVLTLQFVPMEHRLHLLQAAAATTKTLILVEKVLGSTATIDRTLTSIYHDKKRANGYTNEEVERKRLALEGVLVPVTAAWNEDMLRTAQFRHTECVWRWANFAAWIALH